MTTSFEPLLAGVAGTEQTLALMKRQVAAALTDPAQGVRQQALALCHAAGVRGGDRRGEARAIFAWVVEHVEFRRDPTDIQLCVDPRVLVAAVRAQGWAAGNCVAQSELIATLGHAIRLPIEWVILGPSVKTWEHVYPVLDLDVYGLTEPGEDPLLAMDTAVPSPEFGRATPTPGASWLVQLPRL